MQCGLSHLNWNNLIHSSVFYNRSRGQPDEVAYFIDSVATDGEAINNTKSYEALSVYLVIISFKDIEESFVSRVSQSPTSTHH